MVPATRAAVLVLTFAFAALVAPGCAGIVGIHDLSADEDDAAVDGDDADADAAAADSSPAADAAIDAGDAAAPSCTTASCPFPGTCAKDVCTYTCANAIACFTAIKCPPGIECDVTCSNGACGAGIDCSQASKCELRCSGDSCNGPVTCDGEDSTLQCDSTSCTRSPTVGAGCTEKH